MINCYYLREEIYRWGDQGELRKRNPIRISSCEACYRYNRVRYAIDNKDWELAEKEAKPILDGKLKCRQHPKLTVCALLSFALNEGDWKKSKQYAALLEGLPEPEVRKYYSK